MVARPADAVAVERAPAVEPDCATEAPLLGYVSVPMGHADQAGPRRAEPASDAAPAANGSAAATGGAEHTRDDLVPAAPSAPLPPQEAFEDRLAHEILVSERLRVRLLAAIPGVAFVLFLSVSTLYPEGVDHLLHGRLDRLRLAMLFAGITAYEVVSLQSVERLIARRAQPTVLRRYLDALVETSLPTLILLYYMTVVPAAEALLLPPVFIYFVFILLSTLRLDFTLCAFTGLVASAEYALMALAVVDPERSDAERQPSLSHHLGKAAILLASGIAAGFVARRLRLGFVATLHSIEERNRIRDLFGQHVSPAVVDDLLARGAGVKSEVREVCVMFLDIRDFTAFSEKRSPEEVVTYLNAVFGHIIACVDANHGTVNKFLGDGFMAIFGAPLSTGDDCKNAVTAALEIVSKLEQLVDEGAVPPTRIGIALHAGPAVVGNVGSAMRKEYTVIGDVVNVASRLEALNKSLGSRLLVTEEVFERAGRPEGAVPKEPMHVRGREEPIRILQLA